MKSKTSSSRNLKVDIVRLHHATGLQRDELLAKIIYELLVEPQKNQYARKRKEAKGPKPENRESDRVD